ncbi:MAG: prolyl aminopeptidase [Thermoanaerobaculia bacterium]
MSLFPELDPQRVFRLPVSQLHTLHVEEVGPADGAPILFLHGGPGAGISTMHRRFFDPSFWRVILFDQRGSGKSTPLGELRENTTWDLVDDIERLRKHLGIEKWVVFGGSWGSTLALAYAEKFPERVQGLILRGIFLARRSEIAWTFDDGARRIYPDGWDEFIAPLSARERGDVLHAYHRKLTSDDHAVRRAAAIGWNKWEEQASKLVASAGEIPEDEIEREIALAQIEAHYFVNDSFLLPDNQLLRDAVNLQAIPGIIIHGRYDIVCPLTSAWELAHVWKKARLEVVPGCGHAADEPGITDALVRATEEFKAHVR